VLGLGYVTAALSDNDTPVLQRLDLPNAHAIQTMFGRYGSVPAARELSRELRLRIPTDSPSVEAGLYSYFALSGDFEIQVSYALVVAKYRDNDYSGTLALLADSGDVAGLAQAQLVCRAGEDYGYALLRMESDQEKQGGKLHWPPRNFARGKLVLRRTGDELVFLAAEEPALELEEVSRLPFTDRTIRSLRLRATSDGGDTWFDVRVFSVLLQAEEITGGIARRDASSASLAVLLEVILAVIALALVAYAVRYYKRAVSK
jgi:hypothetical protein